MNGAAGLIAVGVGRYAAHRMHRHRPADHFVVTAPLPIGPGLIDHHFLFEGGLRQFGGDAADGRGADAGRPGHRIGAVFGIQIAFGKQMKHRPRPAPAGQ